MDLGPFIKWCADHAPFLIGMSGDTATFAGAVVLATDAIRKEQEIRGIKKVAATLKSPFMARLKVEMEGIILSSEEDVQVAFIRRSARKAVVGCTLLCIGFLALLIARFLEFYV